MTTLEEPRIKLKVCLVGEPAVGKTSLIRRFVYDDFTDDYTVTLGTRITKKELRLPLSDGGAPEGVTLVIWDIMGQEGIRELLKEAFFQGAQGILMVSDVTRPGTLALLEGWRDSVAEIAGTLPSYLLASKVDLVDETSSMEADLEAACQRWNASWGFSSAKTGQGVDEAFEGLARLVLDGHRRRTVAQ
ncbi:MAG: Rab family GTPase [Thermoplasmata archaeon]